MSREYKVTFDHLVLRRGPDVGEYQTEETTSKHVHARNPQEAAKRAVEEFSGGDLHMVGDVKNIRVVPTSRMRHFTVDNIDREERSFGVKETDGE